MDVVNCIVSGVGSLYVGKSIRGLGKLISDFNGEIERASYQISNALSELDSSVQGLNNTFDNEFNSLDKRAIKLTLSDMEGESVKLSTVFNDVPLFKSDYKDAFKNAESISVDETLKICDMAKKDRSAKSLVHYLLEASGLDDILDLPPQSLLEFANETGYPVFVDFFNILERERNKYVNLPEPVNNPLYKKYKGDWCFWTLTDSYKSKVNRILDMCQSTVNKYSFLLLSPREKAFTSVFNKYMKKEFDAEVKKNAKMETIYKICNSNNADEAYYLSIEFAPNVNVGNENF